MDNGSVNSYFKLTREIGLKDYEAIELVNKYHGIFQEFTCGRPINIEYVIKFFQSRGLKYISKNVIERKIFMDKFHEGVIFKLRKFEKEIIGWWFNHSR